MADQAIFRDHVLLLKVSGGWVWRDNAGNGGLTSRVFADPGGEKAAMADAASVRGPMNWIREGGNTRGQFGPHMTVEQLLQKRVPPHRPWNALLADPTRCHHDCRARTARADTAFCSEHTTLFVTAEESPAADRFFAAKDAWVKAGRPNPSPLLETMNAADKALTRARFPNDPNVDDQIMGKA